MGKKKKQKKPDAEISAAYREYLIIKRDCKNSDDTWKDTVTPNTRKRFTELEEILNAYDPSLLELPETPKSFLDYL